jgi:hypothetical protein
MGKSFADYQAEHLKEPFPLPMPDGSEVLLPLPTIEQEKAMAKAGAEAREAGEWTPFTGIEVLVGDAKAAQIEEAWSALPPEAWDAALADMRAHFGRGKAES